MLNSFLRETYKSKAVTSEFVHKNLNSWKITGNQLSKTFIFEDFKNALAFVNIAGNYIDSHKINAQISNVYNKVTVSIDEKILKQLTTREVQAASYLDHIGGMKDIIENLVEKDYYTGSAAFPKKYSLDIASQIPTDPWQDQSKYLITAETQGLKLI